MAERLWANQQLLDRAQLHVSMQDLFRCVAVGFSQMIGKFHKTERL